MNQAANKLPVVLIDGSSYLFRAFHALPPLTTSQGQPTGAIKGVVNMIRKLQNDFAGSQMIVIFDAKGKTFRHDLFPEYKSNRPPMPEELASQIEPLHHIILAMGLPLLVIPGVEADDVIGALSAQAEALGQPVVISTGDKDLAQLVNSHVTLINTMTETTMDREGVVAKFGVTPEQIVDYLALIGDTVDNIPGVPKCGPKTAVKWLETYQDLDNIMANAAAFGGKIGENLRAALAQLPLSRELATIRCDITLPEPLDQIKSRAADLPALKVLLEQLEFKSWLRELNQSGGGITTLNRTKGNNTKEDANNRASRGESNDAEQQTAASITQAQIDRSRYATVTSPEALLEQVAALTPSAVFAFDTETTSLNYMNAQLVGVSLCSHPGNACYIPLAHDVLTGGEQLPKEQVLAVLKPLLENPGIRKVAQNLKYDAHIMLGNQVELQGFDDTMLMSYVLDPTANRHDMDTLSEKHLGHTPIAFSEVAGKGNKQLTFNQVDIKTATEYAAEDADVTLRLHAVFTQKLQALPALQNVYKTIELPLVPVLVRMEQQGATIDDRLLKVQSQELAERLRQLEEVAYDLAGERFNLGSPKQLQEIFYQKLKFDILKKTPTGQPSTAEPVLAELAEKYELPRVLLEYRGLSKLKSTYTDRLPEMINPRTGRVHTSYHQAVAATGRLSSSDPNLQNIPIRTQEGRRIRQAFIAPPGCVLISADYSQVELRIMAHLSADPSLCRAFAEGLDVHRATAAEVFGVPLDAVSDEQRRRAKAINFGLIYGMSAFGLANQLRLERAEAQHYINLYFERYPGVRDYMDRIKQQAHNEGFVETLFGRRLYLPDINARNQNLRQAAERVAINAPMQGTAADIIKLAMIRTHGWLQGNDVPARMIMQVHDELILECETSAIDEVRRQLVSHMAGAAELKVPLVVDAGVGANWDEAH
jgi:DNA polymerase-1